MSRQRLEGLAREIRRIHRENPSDSLGLIEGYLEGELHGLSPSEKLSEIDRISSELNKPSTEFKASGPRQSPAGEIEEDLFSDLVFLLLGQRLSQPELRSKELVNKLAESLNTAFDSLNELTGTIRGMLTGSVEAQETIRHVIRSDMEGNRQSKPIQAYIEQIREAFLIADRSFKLAARNEIAKILGELDPDRISHEHEGGLKFGFMRKAEFVESYRDKYNQCKKWFESGRFLDDLSYEFERSCQKMLSEKKGKE